MGHVEPLKWGWRLPTSYLEPARGVRHIMRLGIFAPPGLDQISKRVPILSFTAVVKTARADCAIGKLNDEGRSIAVIRIPWTDLEHPSPSTTHPRFGSVHIQTGILDPFP